MSTLIIDLKGHEATQEEIEILSHPLVAGLILFTRNFYDVNQLQALILDVRKRVKKPLLISVDQEGGRVQRFRQGFTQLPAMQAFLSMSKNSHEALANAKSAGWLMSAEMFAMDIDLSFAPVLDVGHLCKAIGDRSFSDSELDVTNLARAFIQGMQQTGMAAIGKHFPGHGHVIADSHLETPCDERAKNEIFTKDIIPFQQLINEELLQGIMPAHVIYQECDAQPASGSEYWLKQVLRNQLHFQGAIFSDDLGMKGAGFMGDFVQRAEQSLKAGCDLLLLCNEREGVVEVLDNLTPYQEKERLARITPLHKRKNFTLAELQSSERWIKESAQLSRLQQEWLSRSA